MEQCVGFDGAAASDGLGLGVGFVGLAGERPEDCAGGEEGDGGDSDEGFIGDGALDEEEAGGGEEEWGDGVAWDAEGAGEVRFFFSEDEDPDGGGGVEGIDRSGGIDDGIDEGAEEQDEEQGDGALDEECGGGGLEFGVPLAEGLEGGVVLADGVGDAGAGEDESIDGAEGGDTDEEADECGAEVREERGDRIGGDGVGVAESLIAEGMDEGEVSEEVERGD
ncbi:MAG: hypothetical protein RI897_4151 [Verrucomicrobiota bacterium]